MKDSASILSIARWGLSSCTDDGELTLRYIKFGTYRVYREDMKKAGLFSHMIDFFKWDGMNPSSNFLFPTTHAEQPEVLFHQVWIVIVKSRFVMGGFVPAQAYYDASSIVIEYVLSVAAPFLKRIFASDHFVHTKKKRNRFVILYVKNGTKSCLWLAKVLCFSF